MNGAIHDVLIVGGSFAGLTAALQLGRASRSTLVIDAGEPRNRTSPAAHGVPGWDGMSPGGILVRFREDLAAYPTVTLEAGRVTGIAGSEDAFTVTTEAGAAIAARRIILAHGVRDVLPSVPGLAAAWGRKVLHCPYCHGYEVKGKPLAVLATKPTAMHQARMLRADWSEDVTLLSPGQQIDAAALAALGIRLEARDLVEVQDAESGLTLVLSDKDTMEVAALFLAPTASLDGSPAASLGCLQAEGPLGPHVQVGPMGQTSVPGVFAAGDLARAMPNITLAMADGTLAAGGCHASLVAPGLIEWLREGTAA